MRITRGDWARLPKEVKTFFWIFIGLSIVVLFIGFLGIIKLVPFSDEFNFTSGLLAGIFGILIGFSLDRISESEKEKQTVAAFIKFTQDELTEIRKMPSDDSSKFHILHTDIWDSMVSSGILGLLEPNLVTKLASLYRQIKDASFEAEAFRKSWDEYQSTPDKEIDRKFNYVGKKLTDQATSQKNRIQELHRLIDNLFDEFGWTEKEKSPLR